MFTYYSTYVLVFYFLILGQISLWNYEVINSKVKSFDAQGDSKKEGNVLSTDEMMNFTE